VPTSTNLAEARPSNTAHVGGVARGRPRRGARVAVREATPRPGSVVNSVSCER
jgi:hypothetical protein